ncbi:hypothetical protein M4J07_005797 [Streptomyces longispororuber]|nr:hypothetical protein [Streptomyces longispororuber]MCQ4214337.1 hypothetical protein [Streptomyces longispororuber]
MGEQALGAGLRMVRQDAVGAGARDVDRLVHAVVGRTPAEQEQVERVGGVVGVQVGEEDRAQVTEAQPGLRVLAQRAVTGVHQIRPVPDDDRGGGALPPGRRARARAGAEQEDAQRRRAVRHEPEGQERQQ